MHAMPALFRSHGFRWAGIPVTCAEHDFPDSFHSDAVCSDRLRARLDELRPTRRLA